MDLRDNISERRRASNLTQEDVASRLGVSRQTIGKWESGKATPELDKLVALCDLLGCSLDELVGRAESEHEAESDVSIPNEEAANDSHENSAAEMASPDLPVEEESLRHGTATRYAAILAAGVWLVVASIGLLALLLGPSSVENVEVRRIVPVVAALGVGFGVVLIVAAQLYKAKCMQSGATEASMTRRARVIAVIALAVIVAAVCALVALAPEMRTTAFICIEVAALAAWPIVFAVALAIDSGDSAMEYLAIYVCELACTAIPAFIAFLAYGRLRRRNRSSGASSVALAAVFSAYLFALFHFTGAGTLHDAMRFGMDFNPHQLSLVPFTGFLGDIEGHVLNVLLFVPLGLLVPMVSGTRPDALRMALMAVATSVAIEVSQLLNSRVTDVDDLLMNIIGALLGYGLLTLVSQTRKERSNEGPGIILPTVMIVAAFLGRFLLYDEMGLAKLLFSF